MLLVVLFTNVKCTQVFSLICIILLLIVALVASDMCLPKTGVTKGSSKVIPGWNEHVQPQQDTSLFWHSIWVQCGRPHNGEIADITRRTRSRYHYTVRYIIKEETGIKSNRMAEAISKGNDRYLFSAKCY